MNEILQTTADNLNARGFDAQIFNTADEVKRAVMDFIGEGKTVGIGGSVTVRELGPVSYTHLDVYKRQPSTRTL